MEFSTCDDVLLVHSLKLYRSGSEAEFWDNFTFSLEGTKYFGSSISSIVDPA